MHSVNVFSKKWGALFWNLSDTISDNRLYADTSHLNLLGSIRYNHILSDKIIMTQKVLRLNNKSTSLP